MYNSLLLKKLKKHFVDNNKHLLREHEKFDEVNSAKTLVEFVAAAAHFSELHPTMHAHVNHPLKPSPTDWAGDGVSDYPDHMRDYFFRTNPMVTIKKLKVPVIVSTGTLLCVVIRPWFHGLSSFLFLPVHQR